MLFEILELLSVFDWITPGKGFIEDIINDPTPFQSNSWTFFVPYHESLDAGWNAMQIEDLMAKHGIHHWGSQITGGEYFFSVKLDSAGWAEYVLLRYGVPISELSMDPPRPRLKRPPAAPPSRPQTGSALTASKVWAMLRK